VGARFSAPVQTDPGAHPTSYTMGTGSFPGVKRLGHGIDHPPPSNAEVEGRLDLYICSPSGAFVACSRVSFTFTFTHSDITALNWGRKHYMKVNWCHRGVENAHNLKIMILALCPTS